MELLLFGHSDSTTLHNQIITLEDALILIESQDTLKKDPDSFIGFQLKTSESCIQFMRVTNHNWIIDLPFYKDDVFVVAKKGELKKRIVNDLVQLLFDTESELYNALVEQDYQMLESLFYEYWELRLIETE